MHVTSADRVSDDSASDITRDIQEAIDRSILWHAEHPREIHTRLKQLDGEWDVERALGAGSSVLSLIGVALGYRGHKRWLTLPAVAQGFSLQHALSGWCPPLPVLRRLGFRTSMEIESEKYALRDLLSVMTEQAGAEEDELLEEVVVLEEFTVVGGR